MKKKKKAREYHGGPVVKIRYIHLDGLGSIPDQGTKMLQVRQHGKKKNVKLPLFADDIL